MRSLKRLLTLRWKVILICFGIFLFVISALFVSNYYFFKPRLTKYNQALQLMADYSYTDAQLLFDELDNYKDSAKKSMELSNYIHVEELISNQEYAAAIKWLNSIPSTSHVAYHFQNIYQDALLLNENNDYLSALSIFLRLKDYEESRQYANALIKKADLYYNTHLVSGYNHELYLSPDGSILTLGNNTYNQCNVSDWKNLNAIYAKANYTVGITKSGTLYITGDISEQGKVLKNWSNIKEVLLLSEPKLERAFGLTLAGTIVSSHGNAVAESWTDIDHIYGSSNHIVGLKKDGTVVATGRNNVGQCNVETWTDIVQIVTGSDYTLGLTQDGKVLLAGNTSALETVLNWSDIIYLFSNDYLTIGLKSDGTFISTNATSHTLNSWKNISCITLSSNCAFGLEMNGTLTGLNLSVLPVWSDLIMIKSGEYQLCGLTKEHTLVVKQLKEPPTEDDFVIRNNPTLGMTADQVLQSSWRQPANIIRTTNSDGLTEQWSYSDNRSITFLNGFVISIQEESPLPTS